tara:strand:+ start:2066 stop:2245 length:180 start_codon:yes stop_codon:yes gene_type:complete
MSFKEVCSKLLPLSLITFLPTKMISTTHKSIALKIILLYYLPYLILFAGVFQVDTSVIV